MTEKLFNDNPQEPMLSGIGVDSWWDEKRKIKREAVLAAKFGVSAPKPCQPTQIDSKAIQKP